MRFYEELRMLGMTYIVWDTLNGYIMLAIRHTFYTLKLITSLFGRCF